MRNKIEILSEALNKHFTGVSVDRFEILYPILTDAGLLLPPSAAEAFFRVRTDYGKRMENAGCERSQIVR